MIVCNRMIAAWPCTGERFSRTEHHICSEGKWCLDTFEGLIQWFGKVKYHVLSAVFSILSMTIPRPPKPLLIHGHSCEKDDHE